MKKNEPLILVVDLETTSLNTEEAVIKTAGVWSNKTDKIVYLYEKDLPLLKKAIRKADFVVTFNGERYDIPVLLNQKNQVLKYESSIKRKHIDLYPIIKKRAGMFGQHVFKEGFSLDAICKALKIGEKIDDFDYRILLKEVFTPEDKKEIERYLKVDIELTRDLFLFLEDMFEAFKQFLPEKDVLKKNYIKSSPGSLAYKVICHLAGLPELYRDSDRGDGFDEDVDDSFKGGDVLGPYVNSKIGRIRPVDYASEYPHAFMQANLFSPCKHCIKGECEYRYEGGTINNSCTLSLYGSYCTKNGMGLLERTLLKMYLMRMEAKKEVKKYKKLLKDKNLSEEKREEYTWLKETKDGLQYALKIVINTIYGLSSSPKFVSLYFEHTAPDCTKIGRFWLNYLHIEAGKAGYERLYGDTDSCYLVDPYESNEKLQKFLDRVLGELKSIMPFPQDTFKIEIEDPVQYIQFFKDKDGHGYKKKMYIMLLDDGTVKVKGLPVIKSDSSLLAREIWNRYLKPYVAEHKNAIVSRDLIDGWMEDILEEDIEYAAVEFKVKEPDTYQNPNQLHAQIAAKYGEGRHLMIKNKIGLGVGKSVNYLPVEEAKKIPMRHLDLSRTYSDLSDLILSDQLTLGDIFTSDDETIIGG